MAMQWDEGKANWDNSYEGGVIYAFILMRRWSDL